MISSVRGARGAVGWSQRTWPRRLGSTKMEMKCWDRQGGYLGEEDSRERMSGASRGHLRNSQEAAERRPVNSEREWEVWL